MNGAGKITTFPSHRTTEADRLFLFRGILVGLGRIHAATTPVLPIGLRFRSETCLLIGVGDAGAVDAAHPEEEVRVEENLKEVVVGNTLEIFLHRVGIGRSERRTLCQRVIETKAPAGKTGQRSKATIVILHQPATEINVTESHFQALPRTVNSL